MFRKRRGILWETEEPSQMIPRSLSPELKQPELEAHHSPRSSAEAEKVFMVCAGTAFYSFLKNCQVFKRGFYSMGRSAVEGASPV